MLQIWMKKFPNEGIFMVKHINKSLLNLVFMVLDYVAYLYETI
jgi:hypothetical protein